MGTDSKGFLLQVPKGQCVLPKEDKNELDEDILLFCTEHTLFYVGLLVSPPLCSRLKHLNNY